MGLDHSQIRGLIEQPTVDQPYDAEATVDWERKAEHETCPRNHRVRRERGMEMDGNSRPRDVAEDRAYSGRIEIGEVREELKAAEAELRYTTVDLRDGPVRVGEPEAAEGDELGRVRLHDSGEVVVDPHRPLVGFRAQDVWAQGKTMAQHRDIHAEAIHRVELCLDVDDLGNRGDPKPRPQSTM